MQALPIALILSSQMAFGATIVDFGSNAYVSATQTASGYNFAAGNTAPTSQAARPFSETSAFNPTANYTGPVYYGGATVVRSDNSYLNAQGLINAQVLNNSNTIYGNTNRLSVISFSSRFTGEGNAGVTGVLTASVFFKKEDFLGSGSTDLVSLDSTSSFTYAATAQNGTALANGLAFIVEQDGLWYRSNFSGALTANGALTNTTTVSFNSLTWYEWDPNAAFTTFGTTVASVSFTDIDAIGIVAQVGRTGTSSTATTNYQFFLGELEINASLTPVPEPGTTALLLLGCAGTFAILRRKARRQ